MNPSAPCLLGRMKLHKQDKPIWPIVNWKNCPAYNVAKHLNEILHDALQLPNTFNVKYSTALILTLMQTKVDENTKLCSFCIENMYTNVPITDVKNTMYEVLSRNNVNEREKEELLNLLNVVLEQNYIHINEQYYTQNEGLAMGVPTSAILAEAYIRHLEHISIVDILNKHQMMYYYRYMGDILIIYNVQKTNIMNILDEFKAIYPKFKFTMEQQTQNMINYIDLTITKKQNVLSFGIYRKPTATDLILLNTSRHPY
jgi:hypothetical protein